jgi:hypothetical protein
MDEKTEALRDIFLDVADEETVTESQEEERGSLTGEEGAIEDRLGAVLEEMREKFTFATDHTDEAYCRLVRLFYDGADDDGIADELSWTPEAVFAARMDLHLIRDDDPPGNAVDEGTLDAIKDRLDAGESPDSIAGELGIGVVAVEQASTLIEARNRSRRVSHRFRTEFEEILTDVDLTVQLTAETQDDGLDGATEGAEVDVDF